MQLQRQQDLERISELEGFCTELVKQVEHWRRLDKQGQLIHAQIEQKLAVFHPQATLDQQSITLSQPAGHPPVQVACQSVGSQPQFLI